MGHVCTAILVAENPSDQAHRVIVETPILEDPDRCGYPYIFDRVLDGNRLYLPSIYAIGRKGLWGFKVEEWAAQHLSGLKNDMGSALTWQIVLDDEEDGRHVLHHAGGPWRRAPDPLRRIAIGG